MIVYTFSASLNLSWSRNSLPRLTCGRVTFGASLQAVVSSTSISDVMLPVSLYCTARLFIISAFSGKMCTADSYNLLSEYQSRFLCTVLTVNATRRYPSPIKTAHFASLRSACWTTCQIPKAINRQTPILGMYSILSATTNPTGKRRLDAGRYGKTIKNSANRMRFWWSSFPLMLYNPRVAIAPSVATVAIFQGLASDVTIGTPPILQSQERWKGLNINQLLTKHKCSHWSWR